MFEYYLLTIRLSVKQKDWYVISKHIALKGIVNSPVLNVSTILVNLEIYAVIFYLVQSLPIFGFDKTAKLNPKLKQLWKE